MESTVSVNFQEHAFKILLALPDNLICADCPSPSPDWASVTLGVYVCHKCSGVHRSMGYHISRIKSTKLDSWSLRHMYMITYANNIEANTYWEANVPEDRPLPDDYTSTEDLTTFIYDKYAHKKFVDPQGRPPLDVILEGLNIGADKGEHEDKNHYFNRKLAELEDTLKVKALEIPEVKKPSKNTEEVPKDSLHSRLKALKEAKNIQRMGSNPDPSLSVSSSIVSAAANAKKRPVGGSSEFKKDLFEGLTLKAASTTPKPTDNRDSSSSSPETDRKKRNPQSMSSNQPFRLFDSSPSKSKHYHAKSVLGDERSSQNGQEYKDLMVLDQSRGQDDSGEEEAAADRKTQEPQAKVRVSPKKNVQRSEEPFFLNATDQDMAKHGTHLKRPSQEFEKFQVEEPTQGKNRLSPHNRIRPSDPYPAWIVLAGCFLLHIGFGYMYSWGSISAYFAVFFHDSDEKVYYLNVASLSAFIFLGLSIGYAFPEKMVNLFGFRKSVFLSFFAAFALLSICSLTTASFMYSIIPTFFAGFFIGLVYNIPFYCSLQYFTDSGANLKSIFYIFDGIGALIFGIFGYSILDADQSDAEYEQEVKHDTPNLVFSIGVALLVIGTLGSITLKPKFNFVEKDWSALKDKEEILLQSRGTLQNKRSHKLHYTDIKSALYTRQFKYLLQITVSSSLLGNYYLYSYKAVGFELGYTDHFLTIGGGIGILVMCIGRAAAIFCLRIGTFEMYILPVFIAEAALGVLAAFVYDTFLLYFLPIMFVCGFLHTLIKEEVRSNYSEEIECSMTACAMFCFTLANFAGFGVVKLGEFYMEHELLNLVLVAPIIWAFFIERKYAYLARPKVSATESEMEKMMVN